MEQNVKWSLFIVDTLGINDVSNVVLLNTSTMSLASFDREFYKKIKAMDPANIASYCKEHECLHIYEHLLAEEFLLPADVDEEQEYIKSLKRQIQEHDTLAVHFLPTLGCNFRCPYCYQDGIIRMAQMGKDDVDRISSLIDRYLRMNPCIKYLTLTLHGGEPTCNWTIVPYALEQFQLVASRNNAELRTSIVSNGYLLTPEKAHLLRKYNWHRFQVTIDGPPEVHNKRRRLPSGADTFTTIINNIAYILDNSILERVDIRINFDNSNIGSIPCLIDFLAERFMPNQILLSFGYISQTLEGNDSHQYIENAQIQNDDFYEQYIGLFQYALKKAFRLMIVSCLVVYA